MPNYGNLVQIKPNNDTLFNVIEPQEHQFSQSKQKPKLKALKISKPLKGLIKLNRTKTNWTREFQFMINPHQMMIKYEETISISSRKSIEFIKNKKVLT